MKTCILNKVLYRMKTSSDTYSLVLKWMHKTELEVNDL